MNVTSWIGVCLICLSQTKNKHTYCSSVCSNEKARLLKEDLRVRKGKQKDRLAPKGPTLEELRKRLTAREQEIAAMKYSPFMDMCGYDKCKKPFLRSNERKKFCSRLCKDRDAREKEKTALDPATSHWSLSRCPFQASGMLPDWEGRRPDAVVGF